MKIKLAVPIKRFRVLSRSNPGLYYTIELFSDGKLYCDCPAGQFQRGRTCWHRERVKKYIEYKKKLSL